LANFLSEQPQKTDKALQPEGLEDAAFGKAVMRGASLEIHVGSL
jgi:hypothetical protein